jgi:glycine/serine hydroxymethyltransferase
MTPEAMEKIALVIDLALTSRENNAPRLAEAKRIVQDLCQDFPLYENIG